MINQTKKILSRIFSLVIVASLAFALFSCAGSNDSSVKDHNNSTGLANGTEIYGLNDEIQGSAILHCFNWSYNTIKANLKDIAEAGFTAVQTSPVQQPKDYGATYSDVSSNWWKLYQPLSFYIAKSSWLGTEDQLKSLCQEADNYGVKVVCDIVVNHLGNQTDGTNLSNSLGSYESQIAQAGVNSDYFHPFTGCDDGYAKGVVWGNIGMPDLNTSNSYIQERAYSLLKQCVDAGVDGFRFDAAKHIETPSDGGLASNFWPNTVGKAKTYAKETKGIDLYCYGEILNTPGNGRSFSSYTSYMSLTDNKSSDGVTAALYNNNVAWAASSTYESGLGANKVVLWAESHDTYMGNSGSQGIGKTSGLGTDLINKSWAISASRAKAAGLYFSRPCAGMGAAGLSTWNNEEVKAVNHFKNHYSLLDAQEYLSSSGNIVINERYVKGDEVNAGAVIVNVSGKSTNVNIKVNKMADGEYKDQITGNTFRVSGGYISGDIGSTGIAVVYNAVDVSNPQNTISTTQSTFNTDKLNITLGLSDDAISGTYKIGNGSTVTYSKNTEITIGEGMNYEESVTVYLTATDGTVTTNQEYTFKKVDPTKVTYMYFDPSPCTWFGNASAVAVIKFDSGTYEEMSTFTNDDGKTLYYAVKPSDATKMTIGRMVADGNVYNEFASDLDETNDLYTSSSNWSNGGTWSTYNGSTPFGEVHNPVISINQEGGSFTDSISITLSLTDAQSGTYKIGSGASITFTGTKTFTLGADMAEGEEVTLYLTATYGDVTNNKEYKFTKAIVSHNPVATISQEGGNFSNSLELTLGLQDAQKGTYKIGDAAAVEFTQSTKITIGENMADNETVSITLTAIHGTQSSTDTYTFTKVGDAHNPVATISQEGGTFSNTISLVFGLIDAEKGTYQLGVEGDIIEFTSSVTEVFGDVMEDGDSITVTLTATYGSVITRNSYVFTKQVETHNPVATISQEGGEFTISVALNVNLIDATSATYQIGSAAPVIFTSATSFVLGENMAEGESVVVYLTATYGLVTNNYSFTFTKKITTTNTRTIYFDPSACSWFGDNKAVPVIKVDNGNYDTMLTFTNSANKLLYYYEVSKDASTITIARMIPTGSVYNSKQFTLSSTTDLLTAYSNWNNGGSWSTYTGSKPGEEFNEETVTIYFTNNYNWSKVYAYAWGGSASQAWPGTEMTYVGQNSMNQAIYKITVSTDVTGVIFTNGSGAQTVDITTGITENAAFYISGQSGAKYTVGTWTYTE